MNVLHVLLAPLDRMRLDAAARTWLARGDRLPDASLPRAAALRALFRSDAGRFASAALRHRCHDAAAAGTWLAADPAWVRSEATGARLMACPLSDVTAAQAEALAVEVRLLWAESGLALVVDTPSTWCARVPDATASVAFTDPPDALGVAMLECLPQGDAGRPWRRLFTETQVVLHEHPVNAGRVAAGLKPVNALWLWGVGALPERVESRVRVVASRDDVVNGLATLAGASRVAPTPEAIDAAAAGGDALLDLDAPQDTDAVPAWRAQWSRWLRQHRFDAVELTFAGGERFRCRHAHRLRIWRRAR